MSLLSANLQAFAAVARLQTVHAAARELGITQTGVTQRLRALERDLGCTLFLRSRRGMMPTSEGEALLRYCQGAQALEGEALAGVTGAATQAEVRVTLTGPTSILRRRVIPACLPVMRKYEGLLLSLEISDEENLADGLRSGRSQLVIVGRGQVAREMDSKLLKSEKYVLVAPRAWKKRSLAEIVAGERIIDFGSDDRMTHRYLEKFGLLAKARPGRHFVNNTESLVEMFEAELGYGVLTMEAAGPYLERGVLTLLNSGRVLENELALAWYPRPQAPAYWKDLVGAIR